MITENTLQENAIDHKADSVNLKLVAEGFSFPTSICFDNMGALHVAESGLPFGGAKPGGKIWKITNQKKHLLIQDLRAPVNGLAYHPQGFYISEGGSPARISRLESNGETRTILGSLPGPGNYHTNMVAFGPDNKLYFSQGAMTNSGVIGLDAYDIGWLQRLPHAHDIPGMDITLKGVNIETTNPFNGNNGTLNTGAFVPFGCLTTPGQKISAQLPCTSSVMRCDPDGANLELVAWGIRNAYALGFLPDGRLLAIDQGADDRGSRPVGNAPDLLFHIKKGAWYGWPDFIGDEPINDPKYTPSNNVRAAFILNNHHELPAPEKPLFKFPAHTAAVKFDVAPEKLERWSGQLFVALFGDEQPMTMPTGPSVGRAVVRIDPLTWCMHPFLSENLKRPIDVKFGPDGNTLYILDFGDFEMNNEKDVVATPETGKIWCYEF